MPFWWGQLLTHVTCIKELQEASKPACSFPYPVEVFSFFQFALLFLRGCAACFEEVDLRVDRWEAFSTWDVFVVRFAVGADADASAGALFLVETTFSAEALFSLAALFPLAFALVAVFAEARADPFVDPFVDAFREVTREGVCFFLGHARINFKMQPPSGGTSMTSEFSRPC